MMHPQPTSVLLLNTNYELRVERRDGPGLLLSLLIGLRRLRGPAASASEAATDAAATEPVVVPTDRGARVRSGLGGRMEQPRRRRGSRALRRGHVHTPDRGADRRGS